jgi:hypothetical protein
MDETLIVVTLISGIFFMAAIQLNLRNYFKKEKFRSDIDLLKKQNNIQLKKMARDLGLSTGRNPQAPHTQQNIGSLLEIVKNPDALAAITDILQGATAGEMPEGIDGLVDFAMKNPDLVKGFFGGMLKGKEGQETGGADGFI